MDISEPENGSSNGYVDVISDVDVNQNDSDYLPEIELGEENAPPVQRHQRVRRAPEAMKDYVTYSAMVEADGDPLTVEDALSRPDKDKWFQAMQNEYDALIQNATWDLPPEKRPLNCNHCGPQTPCEPGMRMECTIIRVADPTYVIRIPQDLRMEMPSALLPANTPRS
ncbi:hypothetical protein JTB14_032991 [Gonioctena quinquepunctata]|nr:hypothetical protein JTB14_032991 [Gonioctena quinquepunctata]